MTRFIVFMFALFTINAANADDIICDAGYYGDGTTCTKCPDNAPNSDPGATGRTECYSNTLTRPCANECPIPAGCGHSVCKDSCEYVAYWGKGSNLFTRVKSGCESCQDVSNILSVSAQPGYRVVNSFCELCPAGTYSAGGDVTICTPCPTGFTSMTGAQNIGDCGRVLNYQSSTDSSPNKILLYKEQKTKPALAVQIGNDVLYGCMNPVPYGTSAPGIHIRYNNNDYMLSSIATESVFFVTTTPDTTNFMIGTTAAGIFTVNWGDGTIERIEHKNIVNQIVTYSHTYNKPGIYTIGLGGRATGYSALCGKGLNDGRAIMFGTSASNVSKIYGCLGCVFPTLPDGTQPHLYRAFMNNTQLSGEIPIGLFDGIYGKPESCMFKETFYNTPNLTGPTARTANGTRLYDIEYNGEKWIDAYPDAFTDMYTGSGIDTNN